LVPTPWERASGVPIAGWQNALERRGLVEKGKGTVASGWGSAPFRNTAFASTFFIHAIHFSFSFSTDLYLTPAGLPRYFT
jgi:hypothetical protein